METNTEHTDSHEKIEELLKQNAELLQENNALLKKMHRNAVWGFWIRIVWYAVLIGLPFALYFYVLEPYFTALGSDYEIFKTGMQELPGLKTLIGAFGTGQ
jgi:membrane protein insertase Oxa1/YidC/SpoIIIJ